MEKPIITVEEAQRMADDERNERSLACYAEILQVVERHRCRLEAAPYVTAEGRVVAQIRVVVVV